MTGFELSSQYVYIYRERDWEFLKVPTSTFWQGADINCVFENIQNQKQLLE